MQINFFCSNLGGKFGVEKTTHLLIAEARPNSFINELAAQDEKVVNDGCSNPKGNL